ncbi:MAG: carbohydrate-binding domain-containing protein [Ardenticatenales bacterium]|nr:carbohydrate-binding domain-containing protein [Ardenticatenales bacterium]
MNSKSKFLPALLALFLLLLAACTIPAETVTEDAVTIVSGAEVVTSSETATETTTATTTDATATTSTASATTVVATPAESHDDPEDYVVDSTTVTTINLADGATTADSAAVTVDGNIITISAAGAYELSGTLTEGQIVVDTEDEEAVQLILAGVTLSNSSTAPIYVANASKTVLVLADGSTNQVSDGAVYVFPDETEDEPDAAIFSKDDLSISGTGSLIVEANYGDGITSKDGLVIAGGNITVNAVDDGIRGKDYLEITGGTFNITAGGDGLKSNEDEDTSLGYIQISAGSFTINSANDAIQAETTLAISGGSFNLTAGGGHTATVAEEDSAKGLKAGINLIIDGGDFQIDAADDTVHANENIVINGGTFVLSTGDDGIHADLTVTLNGGVVDILTSYEGIESQVITINDGEFHVNASDDAVNVADGSGTETFGGGRPPGGGGQVTEYTGSLYLYINGGYLYVNAGGDGIDVNGAIVMNDGVVIVDGPTEQMNGPLDYDGTFTMNGGFLVAAGSAGMAQTAGANSTQNSLLLVLDGTLQGGTLIHIQDDAGNDLLTFAPAKAYQSLAFSSPALSSGATYTVSYGGSASGQASDGLYAADDYSGGTEYTSFTVSSVVTQLGSAPGRR